MKGMSLVERQKKERAALTTPPFSATRVLTTYSTASAAPAPAQAGDSFMCLWYPHVCARDAAGGDLAAWDPLGKLQFCQ